MNLKNITPPHKLDLLFSSFIPFFCFLIFHYFRSNVPFTPFRAYETLTLGETGGGPLIGAGLLIRGF